MNVMYRDGAEAPGVGMHLVWAPCGPEITGNVNPLRYPCRECGAAIGRSCTRPGRAHRAAPRAPHSARIEDAEADMRGEADSGPHAPTAA